VKKSVLLGFTGFIITLIGHASYMIVESRRAAERWASVNDPNYFGVYWARGEYFIGASYALAVGFSIYALTRFIENRNGGLGGVVSGITMTGVLYVAGCFLLGCCGSPMLTVYLTLFGSSFLGFAKPLTFVLTLVSVVVGYRWLERQSKSGDACCEGDQECKPN
jgi:hypothetical protein